MVTLIAPVVAAAIVAGLSAIVGGIGSSIYNARKQEETNETAMQFSHEEAELAHQRSKDLLDYDSPQYEIDRLVKAGLNPNLAYDNLSGGVPTGAKADTPSLRAPSIDVDSGVDEALKVAQINRLNAAADNESDLTEAQVQNLYKGLDLKDAEIKVLDEQSKVLGQSVIESNARIALYGQKQRETALDNYFKSATMGDRIDSVAEQFKITRTQALWTERYMAASVLGLRSQANMYLSQANLNNVQSQVFRELGSLYYEQRVNWNLQNQRDATVTAAYNQRNIPGGFPLGQLSTAAQLNSLSERYLMVSKQRQLLYQFGTSERVMGLIQGGTSAFKDVADGVSSYLPLKNSVKITSPSGVQRRESFSRIGWKP